MLITDLLKVDNAEFNDIQERVRLAETMRLFTDEMARNIMKGLTADDRWDHQWDDAENALYIYRCLEDSLKAGDYVKVAMYSMFLSALGYGPSKPKPKKGA